MGERRIMRMHCSASEIIMNMITLYRVKISLSTCLSYFSHSYLFSDGYTIIVPRQFPIEGEYFHVMYSRPGLPAYENISPIWWTTFYAFGTFSTCSRGVSVARVTHFSMWLARPASRFWLALALEDKSVQKRNTPREIIRWSRARVGNAYVTLSPSTAIDSARPQLWVIISPITTFVARWGSWEQRSFAMPA